MTDVEVTRIYKEVKYLTSGERKAGVPKLVPK